MCKTSCCSKTKGVTNPFKCEELAEGSIVQKKAIKVI